MGFGWNLTADDQIYECTDPDTAAGVGFAIEFLIVPLWGIAIGFAVDRNLVSFWVSVNTCPKFFWLKKNTQEISNTLKNFNISCHNIIWSY